MYQGMVETLFQIESRLSQICVLYFDHQKVIQMPKRGQSTDKIMKKVYEWAHWDFLHKTLLQCFHPFILTPLSSNLAKEMYSFYQP